LKKAAVPSKRNAAAVFQKISANQLKAPGSQVNASSAEQAFN
jgi:hypothetical protein